MRFFGIPSLRRIVVLVAIGAVAIGWTFHASRPRWMSHPRITDDIGLLAVGLRQRHEEQLQALFDESGVDIRFLLVPTTGTEPIEQFAVRRARELGVGRETGRRGVLILYDSTRHAMRIEVGPNLQGILPDGFIGYVVRSHARAFFEGGDPELGLRLLVRVLHWRIREAQLGEEYDPSFEEYVKEVQRLAIGGGATGEVALANGRAPIASDRVNLSDSLRFAAQPTVEAAFRRFLEWLALERHVARVPLFTPSSQRYLATLPLSEGYRAGWLALEYGKAFAIDQRDSLAMLYFTGTPLASPHFFQRTPAGWQLDINGELSNTLEAGGGPYSWILLDSHDEYSKVFADRYLLFDDAGFEEFYRVAGGDNRRLVTRGDNAPVESELGRNPRSAATGSVSDAAGVEHVTVFQAGARISAVQSAPSVVVLYQTQAANVRAEFGGMVALSEYCASHGIVFLAFNTDGEDDAVADLPNFLAANKAGFPAVHIYRWRPGLLSATLGQLGFEVGREWRPPLVALRDRTGRVVVQGQGISDWQAVIEAARSRLD